MAARLRGDGAITERCVLALIDAIRSSAPFLGGAAVTLIPKTARTAVAVEALAPIRSAEARRASPIAATLRCDVSAPCSARRSRVTVADYRQ